MAMSTTAIHSTRPFDLYWTELRRRAFRLSVALAATLGEMGFLEHLEELRDRIIKSLIAVGASFAVCFYFSLELFEFVAKPITKIAGVSLVINDPTEAFTVYLKVSVVGALYLAAPFVLWQVWRFISPGLYKRRAPICWTVHHFNITLLLYRRRIWLRGRISHRIAISHGHGQTGPYGAAHRGREIFRPVLNRDDRARNRVRDSACGIHSQSHWNRQWTISAEEHAMGHFDLDNNCRRDNSDYGYSKHDGRSNSNGPSVSDRCDSCVRVWPSTQERG
jgi:hypothetical protein